MSRELKIDNQLDSNLRQVKIGDTTTPIELATDKVRIKEHTRFSKDLIIEGDLYIEGSTGDIMMTSGVNIESTTSYGVLNMTCSGMIVNAAQWSADGDLSDNDASIAILPSNNYDAKINFFSSGADPEWTIGNDGSDSDKLIFDAGVMLVGGATKLTLEPDGNLITVGDVTLAATKKLYLDGGFDTYIAETSTDHVRYIVGDNQMMTMTADSSDGDGNQVYFKDASVGFTQLEPTYDATSTVVDFRFSNKQNLTFGAGNIINLAMYFPAMSGNFVLLLKQDGTGIARTITNYKVFEFDETSADGEAAVKFAGGSHPTLTTGANHVDILSFYWDADNEICYGVATLDFQF